MMPGTLVTKDFDEGKIQRDERGRSAAFQAAQSGADQALSRAIGARNAAQLATTHEQKATAMRAAASESRAAAAKLKGASKAARAAKLAPVAAMHSKLARQETIRAKKLDEAANKSEVEHVRSNAERQARLAYELGSRAVREPQVSAHEEASHVHSLAAEAHDKLAERLKATGDTTGAERARAAAEKHRGESADHTKTGERIVSARAQAEAANRATETAQRSTDEAGQAQSTHHASMRAHERASDEHQLAASGHRTAQRAFEALGMGQHARTHAGLVELHERLSTRHTDLAGDARERHEAAAARADDRRDVANAARERALTASAAIEHVAPAHTHPSELRRMHMQAAEQHRQAESAQNVARIAHENAGMPRVAAVHERLAADHRDSVQRHEAEAARYAQPTSTAVQAQAMSREAAKTAQALARQASTRAARETARLRPEASADDHMRALALHVEAQRLHREAIDAVRAAGIRGSAVASHQRASLAASQAAVSHRSRAQEIGGATIDVRRGQIVDATQREVAGPKTAGRPGGEVVHLTAESLARAGVGVAYGSKVGEVVPKVFANGVVPTLNDLHAAFSSHAAYTKIDSIVARTPYDGYHVVEVHGIVCDPDGRRIAKISRTFSNRDGRLEVHHDLLKFDREEDEGGGTGKTLLKSMIPAYQKWGAKEVHLTAAWRGRYVWARMGFDYREGNRSYERQRMQSRLADFLLSKGVAEATATAVARSASNSLNEIARLKVPGVEEKKVIGTGERQKTITMGAGHAFLSADHGPTADMYSARLPIDDPNHPQYKIAREYLGLPS